MENMKTIGENQMICHKPYQKIEALEFGQNKVNFANFNLREFLISCCLLYRVACVGNVFQFRIVDPCEEIDR